MNDSKFIQDIWKHGGSYYFTRTQREKIREIVRSHSLELSDMVVLNSDKTNVATLHSAIACECIRGTKQLCSNSKAYHILQSSLVFTNLWKHDANDTLIPASIDTSSNEIPTGMSSLKMYRVSCRVKVQYNDGEEKSSLLNVLYIDTRN